MMPFLPAWLRGRDRRWWLQVLSLLVLLVCAAALCRWLFTPQKTPFQATVDATTLEFSLTKSLKNSKSDDFLASPASLEIAVSCNSLRYANTVADPANPSANEKKCLEDPVTLRNVRLSSISYIDGTRAKLSVENDGLTLLLTRIANGPDFRISVMADTDSRFVGVAGIGEGDQVSPGEWIITSTAKGCTLNLHELTKGALSYPEADIPLSSESDVLFATEDPEESSLVDRTSTLLFPELPSSANVASLGNGQLSIHDLLNGNVRELSISRNARREPRSFHLVLTGRSNHIDWTNPFSDKVENQALRPFDVILRIRHQPKILGFLAVLALLIKALSTLPTAAEGVRYLIERKKHWHKTPEMET